MSYNPLLDILLHTANSGVVDVDVLADLPVKKDHERKVRQALDDVAELRSIGRNGDARSMARQQATDLGNCLYADVWIHELRQRQEEKLETNPAELAKKIRR